MAIRTTSAAISDRLSEHGRRVLARIESERDQDAALQRELAEVESAIAAHELTKLHARRALLLGEKSRRYLCPANLNGWNGANATLRAEAEEFLSDLRMKMHNLRQSASEGRAGVVARVNRQVELLQAEMTAVDALWQVEPADGLAHIEQAREKFKCPRQPKPQPLERTKLVEVELDSDLFR